MGHKISPGEFSWIPNHVTNTSLITTKSSQLFRPLKFLPKSLAMPFLSGFDFPIHWRCEVWIYKWIYTCLQFSHFPAKDHHESMPQIALQWIVSSRTNELLACARKAFLSEPFYRRNNIKFKLKIRWNWNLLNTIEHNDRFSTPAAIFGGTKR